MMSWGRRMHEVAEDGKLLYWVLLWVIAPSENLPVNFLLNRVFKNPDGIGGDPGWEIEFRHVKEGEGLYYVWADQDISGIEPDEREYSVDYFNEILRNALLEFSEAHPERCSEVYEVIRRYGLAIL
jgi:hypothetical protein